MTRTVSHSDLTKRDSENMKPFSLVIPVYISCCTMAKQRQEEKTPCSVYFQAEHSQLTKYQNVEAD